MVFTLRADGPVEIAQARVDTFVSSAFKWYCEIVRARRDNSRYMYSLIAGVSATADSFWSL